ncbi:uncharacterized protein BO97DRAFT_453530 [Aspergillus homomorphus CBS 101889]|uniref:Uncharacterized protein n=1 Tax=Aspergillus homomorphus (strain CBS 101889) TaxID=1450537 RepID=A0A395HVE5_ASPHC|nr:hypothetical protein BO97DRAFT_453530 [Aspergillus homomorphus CBS 101889]RAL11901.1 hypothetical protein BO97DRAFT_453530 [Aspergillus homomorphus CBS 101889]
MEEHAAHWEATMLGAPFWKDAEAWNQPINDFIDAVHDQTLLIRFPFNLDREEASRAHKRRRRYSMSDVLTRTTAEFSTLLMAGSQKSERAKRSRSESRTRSQPFARSPSTASNSNQSSTSLLRSALHRMSRKRIGSGEHEQEQEQESLVPAADGTEQQQQQQPRIMLFSPDQATPTNPLLEFRGGETWARIPQSRRTLGIDVYLPTNTAAPAADAAPDADPAGEQADADEEDVEGEIIQIEILPLEQLFPLIHFRGLRSLKITGMVQSYQTYIWQAAWLNTGLEDLELAMVCEPRFRRAFTGSWPYIKGGWTLNQVHYGEPVYHGDGTGQLDRTIGEGEYLDKLVIEKAKVCAMAIGYTRHKFSIRTLTLTGFVVDADPFLHWFDVKRLKCLHFKDICVDAGFYLCEPMKRVSILFPRLVDENAVVAHRVDPLAELKVVQLRGGRKVGEIPFTGPESLDQEIPEMARSKVRLVVPRYEHLTFLSPSLQFSVSYFGFFELFF